MIDLDYLREEDREPVWIVDRFCRERHDLDTSLTGKVMRGDDSYEDVDMWASGHIDDVHRAWKGMERKHPSGLGSYNLPTRTPDGRHIDARLKDTGRSGDFDGISHKTYSVEAGPTRIDLGVSINFQRLIKPADR